MIIVAYILFAVSVLAPVYTYAIYPLIIKLLPAKKEYLTDENYTPYISVIVRQSEDKNAVKVKLANLAKQNYPADRLEIITITESGGIPEFNRAIRGANGEIIVISDTDTIYRHDAIRNLVKHFSDKRIGCTVGQLRKVDSDGNEIDNGAFWKYENLVRKQESKLGAVSGANYSIYAFRKETVKEIPKDIIDIDFFISTYILQSGYDVIMDDEAVADESPKDDETKQFQRHVCDGTGYYQALGIFWRLLLPRKGSYVYVSHRVMKWLVPFNMIFAFIVSAILAFYSALFVRLFGLQVLFYLFSFIYCILLTEKFRKGNHRVNKILSLAQYFVLLNSAFVIGLFQYISKEYEGASDKKQ